MRTKKIILMILLKLLITLHICYGTSGNLKTDLDKSWAEFDKYLNCDHIQYIGYYEGMEDDIDMHSKIKTQYLSGINNIRNWHNVGPLKENNELDVFAQSYANYAARTGQYDKFNSVFGLLFSSRLVSNDIGKIPYELYINFDKDDEPFDFDANEDEMIKYMDNTLCRLSTTVIWKSSINIGIGVAKTNEIRESLYIIVAVTHPKPRALGKYKENITPRNIEIMEHDGYFKFLQEVKKREKNFHHPTKRTLCLLALKKPKR
ncbi:uncharacterized protein LOC126902335 isoform X2 [Daktulosphaira vitifoliae]|uniref:uncharacterized protein LOC126902335 isoform X2 n=1 Tax=Daktulosphaira vitifoliae TaxID=58002 RepID=UPI0021AA58E2|nr:uncharacterized protein LOC126902335 isoform X2 [Daktulosphaira vitifoliae]XP_050535448.1 uncharacterized protein LOC126902335 isoform X2 [Daktulosphaira vitifoliae]XP_050535449.1 uncharacterized protein LOC126902335 isoform X2 [Daktulosphaira vitifoliae]